MCIGGSVGTEDFAGRPAARLAVGPPGGRGRSPVNASSPDYGVRLW